MVAITEEPTLFRLIHDGEFAGFVALRKMSYTYRRWRGLRRIQWSTDELESNFFLPSEGAPTGFGICTGLVDAVALGEIRYRGLTYDLVPLPVGERDEVWQNYLSDGPE